MDHNPQNEHQNSILGLQIHSEITQIIHHGSKTPIAFVGGTQHVTPPEPDCAHRAHPMELWRRPFLVTDNGVRTIVPIDWNGFSAFEVSIYPKSRLVLINPSMLFRCLRPAFPSFEKEAWRDLLGATTHVGLRRTDEYWIFLTHSTSDSFSFTHTHDQQ